MAATLVKDVADRYYRQARLYPGFIVSLPISALAIVVGAAKPSWWTAIVLLLGVSGITYLGSQLVRTAGRRKEQSLWASWGCPPTTQLLRFRGAANRVVVQRRHAQLARLFPDLVLPDEATEAANPPLADDHYRAATQALIERTRDTSQYQRIFDELCQYGFRRNLWGRRTQGIWLAGFGLTLTAELALLRLTGALDVSLLALLMIACVDAALLLVLGLVVKPEWVREAADAYAERLYGALDVMVADDQMGTRHTTES
jgi:hypothetical protein